MKQLYLCFLILISGHGLLAQNVKTDSLNKILEHAHDSLKAQLYSQLAWEYRFGTPYKSIELAQKGLEYITASKSSQWEIELLKCIGVANITIANYDKAISILKEAIKKSKSQNDLINLSECEKKLGNAYYFKGNYTKCLDAYYDALSTSEQIGNEYNVGVILMNIGNVYYQIKSWKEAVEFHSRALKKYEDIQASLEIQASVIHNLALSYSELGEIDIASDYYQKAIIIFKNLGQYHNLGTTYNSLGLLYTKIEDFNNAKINFDSAIYHFQKIDSHIGQIGTQINLSKMYLAQKKYDLALSSALEAYEFTQKYGLLKEVHDMSEILVDIYKSTNNYQKALEYQQRKEALQDSLYGLEMEKHISELKTKYETEKKEQEIELLNKDLTIKAQQARQQKLYIILLISGLLILIILVLFLIRQIRYRRQLNILQQAKAEAEQKAKEEENLRLKEEIEHKNRELVSIAINVSDKNKVLKDVLDHLKDVEQGSSKKIKSVIKDNMSLEEDWEKLQLHFNKVHPDYFNTLRATHPNITPLELKHCAYLKINLSIKEISRILNISHKSVQMIHYRMKKKMNLPAEQTLSAYLQTI